MSPVSVNGLLFAIIIVPSGKVCGATSDSTVRTSFLDLRLMLTFSDLFPHNITSQERVSSILDSSLINLRTQERISSIFNLFSCILLALLPPIFRITDVHILSMAISPTKVSRFIIPKWINAVK